MPKLRLFISGVKPPFLLQSFDSERNIALFKKNTPIYRELTVEEINSWFGEHASLAGDKFTTQQGDSIENVTFSRNPIPDQTYWLDGVERILKYPATLPEGAVLEKPQAISATEERELRDQLLSQSDWTVLPDAPLTDAEKIEWTVYRQALRDIPQQAGFPEFVVVPEAPVKE
jgi:hypothetical protein